MIIGHVEVRHVEGFSIGPVHLPGGAWELPIYLLLSLAVGSVLFNLLKGKYGIALLLFLVPGIGLVASCIGAFRLAKPRSIWADFLYDRKTMDRAIERHEPPIDLQRYPPPKLRRGYTAPQPPAASAD